MTETLIYSTLRLKYGEEVLKNIGKIGKLSKSLGRTESHLRFNLQCKHTNITPKYVRVKAQQTDEQVWKIIHEAETKILKHNISLNIKKKENIKSQLSQNFNKLTQEISQTELSIVKNITNKARAKEFEK